jgi:ATP-dependent DNA helicase RecG
VIFKKYGSGYQRVHKAIQNYHTMRFQYEESDDGFMVTVEYTQ